VLLHGPATAAAGIELLGCPTAAVDYAGSGVSDADAHQIDPAQPGDICCALCTSSVSKLAIVPASVAVAPPTGDPAAQSAGPVVWLGLPLGSWAEVRGPPAG
jgi:hypothetical protein